MVNKSLTLGDLVSMAIGLETTPTAPAEPPNTVDAIDTTGETVQDFAGLGHVPDRLLESALSRWLRGDGVFIVTTHDGTMFHATAWAVRVPVAEGTAIESERAARDALALKLVEMGEVTP